MREKAYTLIRDAITFGDLRPGEKLVEADLCERFMIGRTPLREAVRQLQAEGYLDVIPNKGSTIRRISIAETEQVYDLLIILESYAVEEATEKLQKKDIKNLYKINAEFKKSAITRNHKKWIRMNTQFHACLWKASGNIVLVDEIERLRNKIYRSRGLIGTFTEHTDSYLNEHEQIMSMIEKKDPVKASEAMKAHLRARKKIVVDFLRENLKLY